MVGSLIAVLKDDQDDLVGEAACEGLGRLGAPAVGALVETFESASPRARALSAHALGIMGEDAASAADSLLLDSRTRTPACGRARLARSDGSPSATPRPFSRWCASLGEFGSDARWTTLSLVNMLKDQSPEVRAEAARALGKMGPSAAQASLDLKSTVDFDPDENVRREAAEALRRIRNEPDPEDEAAGTAK